MLVDTLRFGEFLRAVEWAEENLKEGFEIVRQPDGSYIVRELFTEN